MRWLRYLPAVLLLAVAGNQLRLVRTEALSPWLGGGFGMFSTTDTWARRHLHAWALSPGVRREMAIPPAADRPVWEALGLPSVAHLQALAAALAAEDTRVTEQREAVEIQVWAPRFDPETLAPSSVLLRSVRVAVGPG